MSTNSGTENEIKLRVNDLASIRETLQLAGFVAHKPRVYERNVIYDTSDGSLRASGRLLRLRRCGPDCLLTFKGPATTTRHKTRKECETLVADYTATEDILDGLGYSPVFVYEKYRSEWYAPDSPGGIATIDETPIGQFLELEGEPAWIDATALRLGFQPRDYITASYGKLYISHCQEHGLIPGHCVFGERVS